MRKNIWLGIFTFIGTWMFVSLIDSVIFAYILLGIAFLGLFIGIIMHIKCRKS